MSPVLSRRTLMRSAGLAALAAGIPLQAHAATTTRTTPTMSGTNTNGAIALTMIGRTLTAADLGQRFAVTFDGSNATMGTRPVLAYRTAAGQRVALANRQRPGSTGASGTVAQAMIGGRIEVTTAATVNDNARTATVTAHSLTGSQSQDVSSSFAATRTVQAATGMVLNDGISFSGMEWSHGSAAHMPGRPGVDYWAITEADVALLASQGVRHVRLPFRFERFETAEGRQALLDSVARVRAAGMTCTIDAHHQAARWNADSSRQLVLDQDWPIEDYVASWLKVAQEPTIRNDKGVSFDLMNEPRGLAAKTAPGTTTCTLTGNFAGWGNESERHTLVSAQSTRTVLTATAGATGNYPLYLTSSSVMPTLSKADGNALVATVRMATGVGPSARVTAQLKVISKDWKTQWKSPVVATLKAGQSTDIVLQVPDEAWGQPMLRLEVQVWGGTTTPTIEVSNLRQTRGSMVRTGNQRLEDAYTAVISALRAAGVTNLFKVQVEFQDPAFNLAAQHPTWWIDDRNTVLSLHLYLDAGNTGWYKGVTDWATNEKAVAATGKWTSGAQRVDDSFALLAAWVKANPSVAGVELGEIGWPNRGTQADAQQWNALGNRARAALAALPVPTAATYWGCGAWLDGVTDNQSTVYPSLHGVMGGAKVIGSQQAVLATWYPRSSPLRAS